MAYSQGEQSLQFTVKATPYLQPPIRNEFVYIDGLPILKANPRLTARSPAVFSPQKANAIVFGEKPQWPEQFTHFARWPLEMLRTEWIGLKSDSGAAKKSVRISDCLQLNYPGKLNV